MGDENALILYQPLFTSDAKPAGRRHAADASTIVVKINLRIMFADDLQVPRVGSRLVPGVPI